MMDEESKRSPPKQSENGNCLLSPGFRSAAAMAGWDEETLLMASLVVEDTPDRDVKHKRRTDPMFKTPPTNSRRKRRDQRKSPISNFVTVLDLGEDEASNKVTIEEKKETKIDVDVDVNGKKAGKSNEKTTENVSIPCIDRLREELSCAICLDICFEPSTTSCGHSFCKKCLRSAADKCGKRCPKCRQLISNGRSCTINTVLWNTIQLLFPQEIEARKASTTGPSNTIDSSDLQSPPARRRNQYRSVIQALNSPEGEQLSLERRRRTNSNHNHNLRLQSFRPASVVLLNSGEAGENSVSRRRRRRDVAAPPRGQDDDASLALRLQRQEFMGAFGGAEQTPQDVLQHLRSSVATASGNLRAMASRAIHLRNNRGR